MSASGFLKRLLGRGASDEDGHGAPDTLPTTQPMPRAAGVALDDYEIGEELGRGAMAVVNRAIDRRSGGTVAPAPGLRRTGAAARRSGIVDPW